MLLNTIQINFNHQSMARAATFQRPHSPLVLVFGLQIVARELCAPNTTQH